MSISSLERQKNRASRLRWAGYGLLIFAYMMGYFHRMAPAVLSGELQIAFQASGTALGVLAASYFYAYTLMQIPSGILADTLGARSVVSLGCLMAGLGGLVFGSTDQLWVACIGRFMVGMGVSVIFIAILKFSANWFQDRQFATLTGLTILLGNLGGLSSGLPLSWALEQASWRHILLVLACSALVLSGLIWAVVRSKPEDVGLPSLRRLEGKPEHEAVSGNWVQGLRSVLKNRATWPGFFVNLGLGGCFFSLAGLWGVPYLRDVLGVDRGMAARHTSLLMLGFALGSMLVGTLSDRMGKRRPVMFLFLLTFMICWIPVQMALVLPLWASLSLFFCLGFFVTGYTITLAVAKEVNPRALSGMATGVVNTAPFLGGALLQPLVGVVMDSGLSAGGIHQYTAAHYQSGFVVLSVFLAIGLIGATQVRETYCRGV